MSLENSVGRKDYIESGRVIIKEGPLRLHFVLMGETEGTKGVKWRKVGGKGLGFSLLVLCVERRD